jgi:hypothetical protein
MKRVLILGLLAAAYAVDKMLFAGMAEGVALSFIGAMGAGAVLGIGGGALKTWADTDTRKDIKKHDEENRRRMEADRKFIMDLYNQSRGSTGSALLPMYFGTGDQSFEKRMAGDLMSGYDLWSNFGGGQQARMDAAQRTASRMSGAQEGAERSVSDIFSGRALRDAEASFAPVAEARTALGGVGKEGWLSALSNRINQLQTADRAKGYSGTGGFAQRNLLNASAGHNAAAAEAQARADYDNASQLAAIQEGMRHLQRSSVGMPAAVAQSGAALQNMPMQQWANEQSMLQSPFNWFRIGNQVPYSAFPMTPSAPFIPSESSLWKNYAGDSLQSLGSAVSGGAFGGGAPSPSPFANPSQSSYIAPGGFDPVTGRRY